MNTTTHTSVRRVVTTAVLGGAAVLVAGPAFAGVPPEDTGAGTAASQTKAQIEHRESPHGLDSRSGYSGASAQTKAKIEQMERALRDPQPAPQPAGSTSDPSDPLSVPITILALLGGAVVAGAAGYTVYRFRHHGQVGAATA
jgi:hypothetical protein